MAEPKIQRKSLSKEDLWKLEEVGTLEVKGEISGKFKKGKIYEVFSTKYKERKFSLKAKVISDRPVILVLQK